MVLLKIQSLTVDNLYMSKVDLYLQASIRENTQKSYTTAIQHYEFEWQGLLPATADHIAHYLSDYAGVLSINTLK